MIQRMACFLFLPDQSAPNYQLCPVLWEDKGEAMCRHRADQEEKEYEECMVLCVCKQAGQGHASDKRYSGPLVSDTHCKGGDRMGA